MNADEIAEKLDIKKGTITTACYRLRDAGVLVQIGDEWGLKEQEMF